MWPSDADSLVTPQEQLALAAPEPSFHVLCFTGAAKVLQPFGEDALDHVDAGLATAIRAYGLTPTASDFLDARGGPDGPGATVWDAPRDLRRVRVSDDAHCAFAAGQPSPYGWPSDLWTSWTPYTYPFNMTQQPALSLPCGFSSDERPIGLQVVGPRHGDAMVLRVAAAYEARTSWHQAFPTLLRGSD